MNRREVLALAARAGLGAAALSALPASLRAALAVEPGPPLLERNLWPKQWETTIAALDRSALTPNELFYVRCHLPAPELQRHAWKLRVSGDVARPIELSIADLRAMPQHEITCVLECAGNGRGRYPLTSTSGAQWEYGAVGNARWRGVRLRDVLERAGVRESVTDFWMEAADRSPFGKVPPFLRSLPARKAREDVLLALEMNGVPIPPLHGGPCRAIVPGWYGMASTKWLNGIRAEHAPSDNHFMAKGYRYAYPGENPSTSTPVDRVAVKSLITSVRDGAVVEPGTVHVEGWAWSGRAIEKVEISPDGLETWRVAMLAPSIGELAWRRFSLPVEIAAGASLTIAARATDVAGEVQPVAARVNTGGYANNSIQKVTLHARG